MFDCDFIVLDPRTHDIVADMSRIDRKVQSKLHKEMEEAMRSRRRYDTGERTPPPPAKENSCPMPDESVRVKVDRLEKSTPTPVKEKPRWKLDLEKTRFPGKCGEDAEADPNLVTDEPVLLTARGSPGVTPRDLQTDYPAPTERDYQAWQEERRAREQREDDCLVFCPCGRSTRPIHMSEGLPMEKNDDEGGFFGYIFCCASRTNVPV